MLNPRRLHVSTIGLPFLGVLAVLPVSAARAQGAGRDSASGSPAAASLITIGSPREDDLRLLQLHGGSTGGYLLRSPSSLTPRLNDSVSLRSFVVRPRARLTYNSDLPYSLNDGALWSGRGANLDVTFGGGVQMGRVRMIVAPSYVHSDNRAYALPDPAISPPPPSSRSPFSSPWHAGAQSIDLPVRFGTKPIDRLAAGQSSLIASLGAVEVGAASENEWWGPGIRNALLLSNNAEGFPHLLVRTARPIDSPLGAIEARWLAGGLTESPYFDFNPGNDLRSIALLGVALAPRGTRGLTVGAARSVYVASSNWASALTNLPQVFAHVGRPDAVPLSDSVSVGGRDALFSLFARYVIPASGAEVYAEWGRAESPRSLRDVLEQPDHSQGYTLGVQWLGSPIVRTGGRMRVQAEATYVEQSSSYRFRSIGSWYTSHAVPQGYTERGQPLGAAIGPGASSQFIAADHVASSWQLGAYLTRIRWLEDVETQKQYPIAGGGLCSHDVSTLPGVRGRLASPFGTMFVDYSSGWRLNVFLDRAGACSGPSRNARNKSLTIGFQPF